MKKKKKGKTKNTVLYNFISGIIIGIGFIIPGVSGGVLAVLLGIYDQIIFAISNLRKNLSKNIAFLFTVLLGVVIGTVLFSKVLIYLLESKEFAIKYVFVGLIIGGIPSLVTTIKNKSEKSINITYTILAFLISIGLIYVEKNFDIVLNTNSFSIIGLFIAGCFYSMGKFIPGVSGAALLMLIGVYEYLLKLLANPLAITKNQIIELIPFGIGFLLCSVILFKLINYLLKKHYNQTYSAIVGFVLGSILFIFPGVTSGINQVICIVLLIVSAILTHLFSKSN